MIQSRQLSKLLVVDEEEAVTDGLLMLIVTKLRQQWCVSMIIVTQVVKRL